MRFFVPVLLSERPEKVKRSISKLYQTFVIVSNYDVCDVLNSRGERLNLDLKEVEK